MNRWIQSYYVDFGRILIAKVDEVRNHFGVFTFEVDDLRCECYIPEIVDYIKEQINIGHTRFLLIGDLIKIEGIKKLWVQFAISQPLVKDILD